MFFQDIYRLIKKGIGRVAVVLATIIVVATITFPLKEVVDESKLAWIVFIFMIALLLIYMLLIAPAISRRFPGFEDWT